MPSSPPILATRRRSPNTPPGSDVASPARASSGGSRWTSSSSRDEAGSWESHAIEINLRKGGTTHPFLTLQFLTDGTYHPESATFTAPSGHTKCFIASDRVESPAYRRLTPDDLFDIAVRHGLHFDQARQTGVVFHMMAALTELGRVGMTAVGDSPEEARALFDRACEILDIEAALAGIDE